MQAQKKTERVWKDIETHRRDKLGKIIDIVPYRMHCWADHKLDSQNRPVILNSYVAYEKPVNSGNLFYERDGMFVEPAGRIIDGKPTLGVPHVAYVAPLTTDQKVAKETADVREQNAALRAEIEALRAEREVREKNQNSKTEVKK